MAKKESEFSKLAGGAKYAKAWKQARTVEAGESFANPDLPDGLYTARLTSSACGVSKKKELYWRFSATILEGKYRGVPVNFYNSLEPIPVGDKGNTRLSLAVMTAKRLGYEFDSSPSPADLEGISDELNKDKPVLQFSARISTGEKKDPKTKKVTKTEYRNFNVERVLEDYEDSTEDDEKTEEEGGDEDEGEDKIEKGDTVTYTNEDGDELECKVISVNGETAKIKGSNKKVYADVALDELALVYED